MKAFCSAICFLTVIPIPQRWVGDQDTMARSIAYFPVVGVIVGLLTVLVAWGTSIILPAWPAALCIVATPAILSGGLHLDGLADTADGFFSSRPRERILEIMKDSHIGTMGVLALIFALFLKVSLFAALIPYRADLLSVAFFVPLAGRSAFGFMMNLIPYARKDGLGKYFWNPSFVASSANIIILVVAGFFTAGVMGVIAAVLVCLFSAGFSFYCKRKIGGGTGDTLGALAELNEVLVLLVLVAAMKGGIL